MSDEIVSIIVPVYNVEKYLKRCVNSLISQTYSQIEIILVDDGSTDSSGCLCDGFSAVDKRIIVVHKENGGLADARNCGIRCASGKYICFVDSDDWIENSFVEKMVFNFIRNEISLAVCSFSVDYVNEGTTRFIGFDETVLFDNQHIPECIGFIEEVGLLNSVCNKMYLSDVLFKKNILFEKGSEPAEDLLFNISYFKSVHSVWCTSEPLYVYMRQGDDTYTRKYVNGLYEKSRLINSELRTLYAYYNMEGTGLFSCYARSYIYRLFICIPNMYRESSTMVQKDRIQVFENMKQDNELSTYLRIDISDPLIKLYGFLLRFCSPFIIDRIYLTLFFIRNKMARLYSLFFKLSHRR